MSNKSGTAAIGLRFSIFLAILIPVIFMNMPTLGADSLVLELSMISDTRINLDWSNIKSIDGAFIVERKTENGNYQKIANLPQTITSFLDSGLSPAHTYTYMVTLLNIGGNPVYSNEVACRPANVISPDSLEVRAVSPSQIDLSWSYPGTPAGTTAIERKTGSTGTWKLIVHNIPGSLMRFSDTDLTPGTSYSYRVKSMLNPYIYSMPYPNDINGQTVYTMLNPPTGLIARAFSQTRTVLTWKDITGESAYIIERRPENGSFTPVGAVPENTTSWHDTEQKERGRYIYRAKALYLDLSSSFYSNETSIIYTPFPPPQNLRVKVISGSSTELAWQASSANETGYEVWRRDGEYAEWQKIANVDQDMKEFTDKGLSGDIMYFYKVRSCLSTDSDYSEFSNQAIIKTSDIMPAGKLNHIINSPGMIQLTWEDNSKCEDAYIVEKRAESDFDWSEAACLPPGTTSYSVELAPYINNYFRVKALNYTYSSFSYSEEIRVITGIPSPPSGLNTEALSRSKILLKWTDNSNNELGFRIERKKEGEEFIEIKQFGPDRKIFLDTGLTPGTIYHYRVKAYNMSGDTGYSNEAYAVTNKSITFSDITKLGSYKYAIEEIASSGVMSAKKGNLFSPCANVTRAEFVSLMVKAFRLDGIAIGSFEDVGSGHKYYKETMVAKRLGIITGDSGNRFYPDMPVTREDAAVIITKVFKTLKKPLPIYNTDTLDIFMDKKQISPNALSSMAALIGESIISGATKNTIYPKGIIRRMDAAQILYRIIDRQYQ